MSASSSVFPILAKTLMRDRRVGSPTDALSFDNFIHTQPNGSALFHHVGGIGPPDISPVTEDHDDLFELPPFGEASSLFSYPVTAMQDHGCNLAFPHGLPRTAAAFRGGRTLCSQSGRAT